MEGSSFNSPASRSRERSPTLDRIRDGRPDRTGEVEGVDCLVVLLVLSVAWTSGWFEEVKKRETDRESSFDSWTACQEFAVNGELWRDGLPLETSVIDKDPIPDGPTGDGEIDDAEFLSEEVRAANLVGVALEIFDPFARSGSLELRGLSVEDAEVARDDELVDEIDPDPSLGGLIGIGWYQVGFVLGVSIFEELEDDVRVVKRPALMGESGS